MLLGNLSETLGDASLLVLLITSPACGPRQDPARGDLSPVSVPLPAYSHNDYENGRPLSDALGYGYRGVEVDFFYVDDRLLVAHDRHAVRHDRTLEDLYLRPLRRLLSEPWLPRPSGEPFLLNLELKTPDPAGYSALHRLLSRYRDIITVVENGVVREGPIQVVLVGWHPPLETLAAQSPRFAAVQCHFDALPAAHRRYPAHLLKLVSLRYGDLTRWPGLGPAPPRLLSTLEAAAESTAAVPGRWLRVYDAPTQPAVYRTLLEAGVDLIGVEEIGEASGLLRRARSGLRPPS